MASAAFLSDPSITGNFYQSPSDEDRVEKVFASVPEDPSFSQKSFSDLSADQQRWVEKTKRENLQIWENAESNETRVRYTENNVGIEITSSDINWNGSAEMKAFEQFDGLRQFGWVEMENFTENYTGRVILPETYDQVMKCEGSSENPECNEIDRDSSQRPYYTTTDGKTVVYVDHFSGVAGQKELLNVKEGRFQTPNGGNPASVNITSLGFKPDLVSFRVTATNRDFDTSTVEGPENFGWGHGFVTCEEGTCTEIAQSTGSGSSSTNAQVSAATDRYSIFQAVTNPSGDTFAGFINGSVTGTHGSGFNVDFDEVEEQQYVTYTAYSFSESSSVDVGSFRTKSSTGTQSINTGFKPNFLRLVSTPNINAVNTVDADTNEHGWTHGWAAENSDGIEQLTLGTTLYSENIDSHVWSANDSQILHTLWKQDSGPINGAIEAELESFDNNGFTLNYRNVTPDPTEGSRFLVTYWAVNSTSEPRVGYSETPTTEGTVYEEVGSYLESVSFMGSNTIESMDSTGFSGTNNPDNHWGWMVGGGDTTSQAAMGFSSHSSSVNAHSSSSSAGSAIDLLYTDEDGNILAREEAKINDINRTGYTLNWTNTTDSSTTDVRVDSAVYGYWGFQKYVPIEVNNPELKEKPGIAGEFNITVNVSTPGKLDQVRLNLTDAEGNRELTNAVMKNGSAFESQFYYEYQAEKDQSSEGLWQASVKANNSIGQVEANSSEFYSLAIDWYNTSKEYRHSLNNSYGVFGSVSGKEAINEGLDPQEHIVYGTLSGDNGEDTYIYHEDQSGGGWNVTEVANSSSEYCAIQTLPVNSTNCVNPPEDLQGLWTLDESGPVAWDHIGGNNGNLVGGINQGSEGIIGRSYSFDGSSGEIDTGLTASDFNISGSKPKTIMAWVYPRSWQDDTGVWSIGTTGSAGQDFSMRQLGPGEGGGEGRWRAQLWGGADVDFTAGGNNRWLHLTMTYDGTDLCIYQNGTEVSCNAQSLNTADADTFELGQWDDAGFMDGKIDEVRIYDRALNQSEVNSIADTSSPLGAEEQVRNNPIKVGEPRASPDPVEETNTVNISVNVSDIGYRLDRVLVNLSDDDGNLDLQNAEMINDSSIPDKFYYEYTVPDEQSSPGTWQIDIRAENSLGYEKTGSSSFEVVERDNIKPEFRRLNDDSGGSTIKARTTEISAEFLDNVSGIEKATLATNETGSFQNYTTNYGSPEDLGGSVDTWKVADFPWSNSSFSGTLAYRIYAEDVSGNQVVTPTNTFEVIDGRWYNKSLKYRHLLNNSVSPGSFGPINGSSLIDEGFDSQQHAIYGTLRGANSEDLYVYHEDQPGGGWNTTQIANSTAEYCVFQTQPTSSISCNQKPDNFELYWTLDESGSEARDYIGGNNGTVAGATQNAAGITSNGYDFQGGSDKVESGQTASDLNVGGSAPKTVMAWARPDTFDGGGVWSLGSTGTDGEDFSMRTQGAEGQWRAQLWGGADIDFTAGGNNQWVHLAITYDGTEVCVYQNGTEVSCNAETLDTGNDDTFAIGEWDDQSLDGQIDDVRVYSRSLGQSEIQRIYNRAGSLGDEEEIITPPPLNSWWNESWSYRKPYDINNSVDQTIEDFQVKLELDSNNVGSEFNWSRDKNSTRFTLYNPKYDNETELNHWVEDWSVINQSATVWVKVDEIPKSTENEGLGDGIARIYHYYGNEDANSTSSGTKTMELFDDFEGSSVNTSKWSTNAGSQATVSGSNLELSGGWNGDGVYFSSQQTYSAPKVMEGRIKLPDSGDGDLGTGFADQQTDVWLSTGTETWTNFDDGGGGSFGNGKGIETPTSSSSSYPNVGSRSFERIKIIHESDRIAYYDSATNSYLNVSDTLRDPFYFHLAGDSDGSQDNLFDWVFLRKYIGQRPAKQPLEQQSLKSVELEIDRPKDFTRKIRGEKFLMNGTIDCRGDCGNVDINGQYETQTTPTEIWQETGKQEFQSFNESINTSVSGSVSLGSETSGASWWNTDWKYRKDFNVSNPSGSKLENYTVDFKLDPTTVGPNFDWNDKGVRFALYNTSSDQNIELDYWIEDWNSTGQNATVWVKLPEIKTGQDTKVQMYYGNNDAKAVGDPDNVFSLYANFSENNIVEETTQNSDGDYQIRDNGSTFFAEGNAWYGWTGFGGFSVAGDGSQILEANLKVEDPGEIISTGLENDMSQSGEHYKWAGSQGYGVTPDDPYDTGNLNTWQDVSAVLNDFSISMSHMHKVAEDDGDASANATFNDVRIRKYVSSEPTVSSGSEQEVSYAGSGRYISSKFDTGTENIEYKNVEYNGDIPANTTLRYFARTSVDNKSWSSWYLQGNQSQVFAPDRRYIQYKIELSTQNSTETPKLDRSSISYETTSSGFEDMSSAGSIFQAPTYDCGALINSNCSAEFNVTPQKLGRYFVRLSANSSEIGSKSAQRDIEVYGNTVITGFDSNQSGVGRGRSVTFKARLRNDLAQPLEGYDIRFNDTTDKGELDVRRTNETGWAKLEYEVPEDATLGNHAIRAAFDGSGESYLLETNETIDIKYSSVPEIQNLSASPGIVGYGTNTTLSADVQDDTGLDSVRASVELPNGSVFNYSMLPATGDKYTKEFDETWTDGEYSFKVTANNTEGIETSSEPFSFAVNGSIDARINTVEDTYDAKQDVDLSTLRDDWFNTNWTKRLPVNIEQKGGTSRKNVPVNISLDTKRLVDAGVLNPDGSDLRFESEKPVLESEITIDNTGGSSRTSKPVKIEITDPEIVSAINTESELRFFETEVENPYSTDPADYWIEKQTSDSIVVWMETDLPIDAKKSVFMYYGNDDVPDEQSYKNTFETKVGEIDKKLQGTSWSTVSFDSGFSQNPVVLASINSRNQSDPVVARVRNINQNDFEMRIEEYPSDDGFHAQELTSYGAFEPGTWIIRGKRFQVGKTTTNAGSEVYKQFNYGASIEDPARLIGQINSYNEADKGSNIRLRNVESGSAQVKIEEDTENQPHTNETVGYIALGPLSSVFSTGVTPIDVTDQPYQINYTESFDTKPAVIGSFQTAEGDDNGHDRITNSSKQNFTVSYEETAANDGTHTTESFGYISTDKDAVYGTKEVAQPSTSVGRPQQIDTFTKKVPYWIESGINTNDTQIWVQVPTLIPEVDTKIFAYYNNSGAQPESNLTAVAGKEPVIGQVTAPADGEWKKVGLSRPFKDPVVVATSNSENSPESPKIAQVRNVGNATFETRLCEPDSGTCDNHPEENITYMVVDKPSFSDKTGVEAGNNLTVSGGDAASSTTLDYLEVFDTDPVVIAQAVNTSRTPPTVIQADNVGTATADIYACQHDGADGCNSVTATNVHWIVAEPGSVPYEFLEAGKTTGIDDSQWNGDTFTKIEETPGVVATVQTNNGDQQNKPVMARSVTSAGMQIRYCEHESGDSCDTHAGEDVGWIAGELNSAQSENVTSKVVYQKNETVKTGLVNRGNTTVKGYISMYVENPEGNAIVPPVVNDRADGTLRTIGPGGRLNISQVWADAGGWNTEEYEPGQYSVIIELEDPQGNIIDSFIGQVVDQREFRIEDVTVNLTDLKHENRYEHGIGEYEVGDKIDFINVSVGAINNTALNANATLDIKNADWGPNTTKLFGDIPEGNSVERSWTNQTKGYIIPLDANTGSYTYNWNISMRAQNAGEKRFNDTEEFTVVNNVETFESNLEDPDNKIIRNESVEYNFSFTNRWSGPIEDVNLTLNCDSSELGCDELGGSNQKVQLGTVNSGVENTVEFNVTTDANTDTKDYDLNVTLEYLNPDEERVWDGYGQERLAVRVPGALLSVESFPVNLTRTEEANFTGIVNNTFSQDLTDSSYRWYLPPEWTNTSGSLSGTESVQSPGEVIPINITLQPQIGSNLGEVPVKVNTTNNENREDEEIVNVNVFAKTVTSASASDPTPDRGENTTLEASINLDNGSSASGVEVDFYDETTNDYLGSAVTDSSGLAELKYPISDTAQLGTHVINMSFDGASSKYLRGSYNQTDIDIGKKPTVSQVNAVPDPVGYGYNVTVSANVTDSDGINNVDLIVENPNGTEVSYNMTNVNTTFYERNFSDTYQLGRYFYSINATDGTGSTFESSRYKFDIEVETKQSAVTNKQVYEPNQDVLLNASNDWWNASFSYRKPYTVSSGQDRSEYQKKLNVDTASLIGSGYMNNSCKDIRFTWLNQSSGKEKEIDHFVETGCDTANTEIWTKIPYINDTRDAELKMYYGNTEAESVSSEVETFSYSQPRTVAYVNSDDTVANGLEVTSLCDKNSIEVAGNSYLLNETDSAQVTSGLNVNTSIKASCSIQAEGIDNNDDVVTPVNWASKSFIHGGARGTDSYCVTSTESTASVEIRDGGSLDTSFTVPPEDSVCVTNDITTGNTGNISANTSILVSHEAGGDTYSLYPPTNDTLYGVPSGSGHIAAGPFGASVNVTRNDGGGSTSTISPSSEYEVAGTGDGGSDAVKVETDNPIGAIQQADGDGTESTVFLPEKEMNAFYGSGRPASYIVVSTPYSGTECTVDGSTTATSTVSGASGVYRTGFGDGNNNRYVDGGWTLSCTNPVYAYYEADDADQDETNLIGAKQIKRTSESITVTAGSQTNLSGSYFNTVAETGIKAYLVGTVERNQSGGWEDVETVINDSKTDTLRNISGFDSLNVSSIWNNDPFNVAKRDPGRYRVNLELVDPRGEVLETSNGYTNTTYEFNISEPKVLTDISELRVYNVTNNPNNRIYTDDLIESGSNISVRMVDGEQYRAEIKVDVLEASEESWSIDDAINFTQEGLNSSWSVSDVWYSNTSDRTDTRFNGGSFNGNLSWDTANGGKVSPGGSITLYYVFTVGTSSDKKYSLETKVSDPRFLDTQRDSYEVIVPENIPPKIFNGVYNLSKRDIVRTNSFKIFGRWTEAISEATTEYNATTTTLINSTLDLPASNTYNWTNYTYSTSSLWSRGDHIAKLYAKDDKGNWNSSLEYLSFEIFGLAEITDKSQASGFSVYKDWNHRQRIELDNTDGSQNLNNFQIPLNISHNQNMSDSFEDIRFSYEDGSTETTLDYWVEENRSSSWAYVWVKVPQISNTQNETLYMYYDNPEAVSASSAEATLESGGLWLTQWDYTHSNPGDEAAFDSIMSSISYSDRSGWGSQSQVDCGSGCNIFGSDPDMFVTHFQGWIKAPETGTYGFGTDSDDASDVHVNATVGDNNWKQNIGGTNIGFYGAHGASGDFSNNGNIDLESEKFYRYVYRHEETGGGDVYRAGWNTPSNGSYSVIPSWAFYHTKQSDSNPDISFRETERNAIRLRCKVKDTTVDQNIGSYSVGFYNGTNSLIGTSQTKADGWASVDYKDDTLGVETARCNINESQIRHYKTGKAQETFDLDKLEEVPPNYLDVSQSAIEVNKSETVELSVLWQDNFKLDSALLETNVSGAFTNESYKELSSTLEWANFSYSPSNTSVPGRYSWRQYANDTSDNYNVTPENSLEVYAEAEIGESRLVDDVISTTENATMECRVEEYSSGDGITGYNVEFRNSTSVLGSNVTGTDGYAGYEFNDTTIGDETISCEITGSGAPSNYYKIRDAEGNDTLTTRSPGSDVEAPSIVGGNYYLESNSINKGTDSSQKVYGLWDESIDSSKIEFNWSSSLIEKEVTTPYTNSWTNATLDVNSSWSVGNHYAKLYATDQVGNTNNTLRFLEYEVRGRSGVSFIGPNGEVGKTNKKLTCRVEDIDTSQPLENFNVDFYDSSNYLGSASTNSTGYASINNNFGSYETGQEQLSCTIASEKFYDPATQTASETVTIVGKLNTTILAPELNQNLTRGSQIDLNSTTVNSTGGDVTPDLVSWTNGTKNIATGENTSWTVSGPVGPFNITAESYKADFENSTTKTSVNLFGLSNVSIQAPAEGASIGKGSDVTLECRVRDDQRGSNLANYSVEFFVENSTDTFVIGQNETASNGVAGYSWNTSSYSTGQYYPGCNIGDQRDEYYFASAQNTDNTTVNLGEVTAELEPELLTPGSGVTLAQNKTFTANASIKCKQGDCGQVDATLRYNGTGNSADLSVGTTEDKPFYTIGSNPNSCGPLDQGEECNIVWEVNATGDQNTYHALDVLVDADNANTNQSKDEVVKIDSLLLLNVNYSGIDFPARNPGETVAAPGNTQGKYFVGLDERSNNADGGAWIKMTDLARTVGDGSDNEIIPAHNTSWSLESTCSYSGSERLANNYKNILDDLASGQNFTQCFWQEIPYGKYNGTYTGSLTIKVNGTN